MILLEVHSGLYDDPFRVLPRGTQDGWRLLTPCEVDPGTNPDLADVAAACPFLREMEDAGGNHADDFSQLLTDVMTRAPSGLPWDQVFDDKRLHNIGDVTIVRASGKAESWKLLQFQRKRTLVRVAWSYGQQRRTMVLAHAFVKPGGKKTTPRNEVERAARVLQEYAVAFDNNTLRLIEAQGGRNGFVELVR